MFEVLFNLTWEKKSEEFGDIKEKKNHAHLNSI